MLQLGLSRKCITLNTVVDSIEGEVQMFQPSQWFQKAQIFRGLELRADASGNGSQQVPAEIQMPETGPVTALEDGGVDAPDFVSGQDQVFQMGHCIVTACDGRWDCLETY